MVKMKKSKEAVSDVLGTVLLLGIAISLFSVLSAIVLTYPVNPPTPTINLIGMIDRNNVTMDHYIILEHRGGDALSLDTKIGITIGSTNPTINQKIEALLDINATKDGYWNLGEKAIYPAPYADYPNFENEQVNIIIVDTKSNSVLLMGTLQEGSS